MLVEQAANVDWWARGMAIAALCLTAWREWRGRQRTKVKLSKSAYTQVGESREMWVVEVSNRGRPVTVTNVALRLKPDLPPGIGMVTNPAIPGEEPPIAAHVTLGDGEAYTWRYLVWTFGHPQGWEPPDSTIRAVIDVPSRHRALKSRRRAVKLYGQPPPWASEPSRPPV